MTTESLTYAELGERLDISPEAARKKAHALRLPASLGNDGKKRVLVDLSEIQHTARRPRRTAGRRPEKAARSMPGEGDILQVENARTSGAEEDGNQVHQLQVRIAVLEAELAGERQRAVTAETDRDHWRAMAQRSWWQRLVG